MYPPDSAYELPPDYADKESRLRILQKSGYTKADADVYINILNKYTNIIKELPKYKSNLNLKMAKADLIYVS